MFASGPASPGNGALCLLRAEQLTFDGPARAYDRPDFRPRLRTYLSDMVRPYGLAFRGGQVTEGTGHVYGEMAAALIGATVPIGQPVDLLVLAFAVPDIMPGRATAVYLSEVCPGNPFAFAISDQGLAAPFTGLRLARQYAQADSCQRVLLLVLEQDVLHYEPAGPVTLPAAATGVALLCDRHGPAAVRAVRQHPDIVPQRVPALLATELTTLDGVPGGTTVILGNGLAGAETPAGVRVRTAPPGRPQTGVWSELAEELTTGGSDQLVLADYDAALGYLCLATFAREE